VLRPDVAFIASERLSRLDVDVSPINGAPNLAIEVISPSNSAEKMLTEIHEYLNPGCQAVWIFYPKQKVVEIHGVDGIRKVTAPASLEEEKLFAGYKYLLPLALVFDEDITKLRRPRFQILSRAYAHGGESKQQQRKSSQRKPFNTLPPAPNPRWLWPLHPSAPAGAG